jgi:hypothetical protein
MSGLRLQMLRNIRSMEYKVEQKRIIVLSTEV